MMTNIEKHEWIFKNILKDFTIENEIYLSSYFIWDREDDSICHFWVKEIPNWKFGIWLRENEDIEFEMFCEHEELIDKFKPSACYFSLKYPETHPIQQYEYSIESFLEKLNDMKLNPKKHFVNSLTGDVEEIPLEEQEEYINKEWDEYWAEKEQKKKDIENDKQLAMKFCKELLNNDNIFAVGLIDLCKGGWITNPQYHCRVVLKSKEVTDDEIDKIQEYIEINANKNNKSYKHKIGTSNRYIKFYEQDNCTKEEVEDELKKLKCDYIFIE